MSFLLLPGYEWCFLLWLIAFVIQGVRTWYGRPTVGLAIACCGSLASVHLIAEVCYWIAGYQSPERLNGELGFRIGAVGILGYTTGVLLYDLIAYGRRSTDLIQQDQMLSPRDQANMGTRIVSMGATLYITGIFIGFGAIPGLAAVFGGTLTVVVTGILLNWHAYRRSHRPDIAFAWLCGLFLIPLAGVVLQGFIGYGMYAMMVAGCFILARTKIRWWSFPVGFAAIYIGLSLWVTYAEVRTELRKRVWRQQTSLSDRLSFVSDEVFGKFELIDFDNEDQMRHLDRLDQNRLVGKAAIYIESGNITFARGDTLKDALLALIPRLIWKDKPTHGGSQDVVSIYTGERFAEGTSVGVGQIMELYINFGLESLFIGMLVIGVVVAAFDTAGGRALSRGDIWVFISTYVIAQPLMLAQGNYAEITAAMFGGTILTQILRFVGGAWIAELGTSSERNVAKLNNLDADGPVKGNLYRPPPAWRRRG